MPNPDTNAELEQKNALEGNPYRELVEGFVEDAPHFNVNQLTHSINESMIEAVVTDAEGGKFTYERKNPDTGLTELGMYGVDDVLGQFELALQAIDMAPNDPLWKNYISRSNGLRAAVSAVMGDKRLADPFRYAVYKRQADSIKQKDLGSNSVEVAHSNTELYEKAAEDLGEEGVEAAGISVEADAARRLVTEVPTSAERQERDPLDYLRKVLPPVVRPTTARRPYVPNDRRPDTPEEKAQKYFDRFVTEENKQESLDTLGEVVKATPLIKEALNKAGIDSAEIEAVNAIRENADVRFEVAKILLNKLNTLADSPDTDMGWRIIDNNPRNLKSDPQTGKAYLSREYAVNMALKMLGGEFSEKRSDSDFARDQAGKVVNGQHRNAATQAMMSYHN